MPTRLAKTLLAIPAALIIILPAAGMAASSGKKSVTSRGISLSPAIVSVDLDQNLKTSSFKINVSNNTAQAVSIKLSSLDFKSLNETGGLAFIGNGSGKYGLANWLVLPDAPVQLKAHSSQLVNISVDNRSDLSPGGHYAAILFKNSTLGSGGSNKVDVSQVVASLVFVKKSGGEIYQLNLLKPDLGQAWLRLPNQLTLPIKNIGNTQTAPRGIVTISDPRQKVIERGIINSDSGLVLPDSTRLFTSSLFTVRHPWLPGRYTLTVTFRPADTNIATTTSYSFFYLSLPSLLFFVALVVATIKSIQQIRSKKYKVIHKPTD